MYALANLAVGITGIAAFTAAATNKGKLVVNDANEGGVIAYSVEVVKDTLRNTAIAVAAAAVALYAIEAAPALWAMLPAMPAIPALPAMPAFVATIWTGITSLAAEAAAVVFALTLPEIAVILAVAAAATLVVGVAFFAYKKITSKENGSANIETDFVKLPLSSSANSTPKKTKVISTTSTPVSTPKKKVETETKDTTTTVPNSPAKVEKSASKSSEETVSGGAVI